LKDDHYTISVNHKTSVPSTLSFNTVIENRPNRYSADVSFDLSYPEFSLLKPARFVFYSDNNRNISAHLQVESQQINHGFRFYSSENNWNDAQLELIRPGRNAHETLFYKNTVKNQRDHRNFDLSFGFKNFEIAVSPAENRFVKDIRFCLE